MRRLASFLVVSLGAAAAGILVASARIPARGPSWAEIDQVAAELDACLRESAAGVRARAQTLAELPRLALAVATDVETVRDLTDEELAFRPRPNETIELAQLRRSGGPPTSLLRLPADVKIHVPLDLPGLRLIKTGSSLRVAAIVRVEPRARADELYGSVAVSWMPDLERVTPRLGALGGGVMLETSAGPIQVGGPMTDEGNTVSVALGSPAGQVVRLVAPAPGAVSWRPGMLATAVGIALGAFCFAIGLIWRRRVPPDLGFEDEVERIAPADPTRIQMGGPGPSPFAAPTAFVPYGTGSDGRTLP